MVRGEFHIMVILQFLAQLQQIIQKSMFSPVFLHTNTKTRIMNTKHIWELQLFIILGVKNAIILRQIMYPDEWSFERKTKPFKFF